MLCVHVLLVPSLACKACWKHWPWLANIEPICLEMTQKTCWISIETETGCGHEEDHDVAHLGARFNQIGALLVVTSTAAPSDASTSKTLPLAHLASSVTQSWGAKVLWWSTCHGPDGWETSQEWHGLVKLLGKNNPKYQRNPPRSR